MEPDEDKVWSSKREKTVAVERIRIGPLLGDHQDAETENK